MVLDLLEVFCLRHGAVRRPAQDRMGQVQAIDADGRPKRDVLASMAPTRTLMRLLVVPMMNHNRDFRVVMMANYNPRVGINHSIMDVIAVQPKDFNGVYFPAVL